MSDEHYSKFRDAAESAKAAHLSPKEKSKVDKSNAKKVAKSSPKGPTPTKPRGVEPAEALRVEDLRDLLQKILDTHGNIPIAAARCMSALHDNKEPLSVEERSVLAIVAYRDHDDKNQGHVLILRPFPREEVALERGEHVYYQDGFAMTVFVEFGDQPSVWV